MAVSVLIADDHEMFRQGLRAVLENSGGIDVVGEAANGNQAVELCRTLDPDIAIMDVTMPEMSGIVATRLIRESGSKTRVILLSMHLNEAYIVESFKSGAGGYVLKESAIDELLDAVQVVNTGGIYISQKANTLVVEKLTRNGLEEKSTVFDILSHREIEVLQLICEGRSTREIAKVLSLSPKTVDNHRANIMNKVGIHDVPSLVRFAMRMGVSGP